MCLPGYSGATCQPCDIGTYGEGGPVATTSCQVCDTNTTTRGTASTSLADCLRELLVYMAPTQWIAQLCCFAASSSVVRAHTHVDPHTHWQCLCEAETLLLAVAIAKQASSGPLSCYAVVSNTCSCPPTTICLLLAVQLCCCAIAADTCLNNNLTLTGLVVPPNGQVTVEQVPVCATLSDPEIDTIACSELSTPAPLTTGWLQYYIAPASYDRKLAATTCNMYNDPLYQENTPDTTIHVQTGECG